MAAPMSRFWSVGKHFRTHLPRLISGVCRPHQTSHSTIRQCILEIHCESRVVHTLSNNGRLVSSSNATHRDLGIADRYAWKSKLWPRNLSSAPSTLTQDEVRKHIETITDKFMEAKDYLEDANDSKESVYFDEDMKDAEDAITETLGMYEDLLGQLTPEQKQEVTRTIGLKMEELRAQFDMIKESLRE